MILSIAWRNVWRNKTRSIIIITSIALGLVVGVFYMAFMQGMVDARIESATKSELAHLQIHAPHFLDNNESSLVIKDVQQLTSKIQKNSSVKAASYRLVAESCNGSARNWRRQVGWYCARDGKTGDRYC